MKKVWFLTFVVGLCAIFGVLLSQKGIRLGKDLQGGVSLVYSVKVPDTGDSNAVLGQVIDVLKQRALNFRHAAKKGELLRAGLQALAALSEADLQAALERVTSLKPGRPKKAG